MRTILISLFCCVYCQAQDSFTYFNQSYWADSMNIFSTAIEPIEDGYLVLGPYISPHYDALYIQKIDKQGRTVWFKNLEENISTGIITTGREVIKIDENNFAVVYDYYYNEEDWRPQLVKFDIEGNIIFHEEFANNQVTRNTRELIFTNDKGFAFVGGKKVFNPLALTTFYLMKTDSLGNQEWEQTYAFENSFSVAHSVAQTPDGGYILGGYIQTGSSDRNIDMYIVKTDSLGNQEWDKRIGGLEDDCPAIVHCLTTKEEYQNTGEIEYLISGCYIQDTHINYIADEIYLFKLDTQGKLIWEQGYSPGENTTNLISHLILPDKSFYGVGSKSKGIRDRPILYRFNSLGELLWKKEYALEEVSYTYMRDIQATDNGGLILAGFENRPNPQKSWILKVDSLGNTCMPVDCDSIVLITNIEEPFTSSNTASFSLFPNPASKQIEVEYRISKEGILKVYDYQGQLIGNWELKIEKSSLILEIGGWRSGVYFCGLEVEGAVIKNEKLVIEN